MKRFYAFLGIFTLILCSCATLSEQIAKESDSLTRVIQVAYDQSSRDLEAIKTAFESGNTVKTHQAITQAEKDLKTAFVTIQKYQEKVDETAKKAAAQADAAKKLKPTFFQSINPGYWYGKSWEDFKTGTKVLSAWIGIGVVLLLLLEFASTFSPILAAVLRAIGVIVGHLISIFTNIADGVFTTLEKKRVANPQS